MPHLGEKGQMAGAEEKSGAEKGGEESDGGREVEPVRGSQRCICRWRSKGKGLAEQGIKNV